MDNQIDIKNTDFRSGLKIDNSLLVDDSYSFTSAVLESLGVSRIVLNNPAFIDEMDETLLLSRMRDKNGNNMLFEIVEKIDDIWWKEATNKTDDTPNIIEKKGHEDLYKMVKSFKETDYLANLLIDHQFIRNKNEIIDMFNAYKENNPNEDYWYCGISIDKQKGGISSQQIIDNYNRRREVNEYHYFPDEKGNVIKKSLFFDLLKDKISQCFTCINTYNSNGAEMKIEDIGYSKDIENFRAIWMRNEKYPFAVHYVIPLNNSKHGLPEGTEIDYALDLNYDALNRLDSREYDEKNETYVTFANEEEMEAYYINNKRKIDRYLEKLGLHVEPRGLDI